MSTQTQSPHLLPMGAELNNKYRIESILGQGGFGITYVGYDTTLNIKIAIKEYYPHNFASRTATVNTTVYPLSGDKGEHFESGKKKFIDEARRLAKFFGLPGIVAVKDFFEQNGTAYIVMEFIEGSTLKHTLTQMGGKMPEFHVLEMMKPLVKSLAEIHKAGIIHRDIKPDNIMIQYPDGNVKLIDFGAAREIENTRAHELVGIKDAPIYAQGKGRVKRNEYDRYGGYYVVIEYDNGYTARYMHLRERPNLNDDVVNGAGKGQKIDHTWQIGITGKTGEMEGGSWYHLHLDIYKNNGSLSDRENPRYFFPVGTFK